MFGVPVRLHFTFILFAVFLTVSVLSSPHSDSNYAIFMVGGLASLLDRKSTRLNSSHT